MKTVLILGANSDVAKACLLLYVKQGCHILAASRNLESLQDFVTIHNVPEETVSLLYFDAADYPSHEDFVKDLPQKPHLVLYAAGALAQNKEAFENFEAVQRMAQVNYLGAVSILNRLVRDSDNSNLERIIGLSSLSGVRARKSNFLYGSTKAAFTHYLAGLRQELKPRGIVVNVLIIGYINTKINAGLKLNRFLLMQPDYVAKFIISAGSKFKIIPNFKWKIIYRLIRILPESLIAKMP